MDLAYRTLMTHHSLIGLLILIGTGIFVVFAFRQGTSVRRSGRTDDQSAANLGAGRGDYHHPGDGGGGFGHN